MLARLKRTKFSQISAGGKHNCGIVKETKKVEWWGSDSYGQSNVPTKTVKWTEEASCLMSRPVVSGPASCIACDPEGCNKYFTNVDPKTNTGTCTKKKCAFCKPKACCAEGVSVICRQIC